MKKIKQKFLIIVIITLSLVVGCNKNDNIDEVNYEARSMDEILKLVSEENVNDIITKEYSNKELDEIESADLNLEKLDKKYKIECIKEDSYYPFSTYKVVYKSNNKFLIICFDEKGEKLYAFAPRMSNEKQKFDSIEIGKDDRNKVYLNDSNLSLVPELDFVINHNSNLLAHYTKDGLLITFEYNENGIVIDRKESMI